MFYISRHPLVNNSHRLTKFRNKIIVPLSATYLINISVNLHDSITKKIGIIHGKNMVNEEYIDNKCTFNILVKYNFI